MLGTSVNPPSCLRQGALVTVFFFYEKPCRSGEFSGGSIRDSCSHHIGPVISSSKAFICDIIYTGWLLQLPVLSTHLCGGVVLVPLLSTLPREPELKLQR